MEGIEGQDNNQKDEKSLKVNIVRHGPSLYRQPEWTDINTADDLNAVGRYAEGEKTEDEIKQGKERAIEIIRNSAEKIADEIGTDEEVIIWSSPTGRTLETARIISEVLEEKGIRVKRSNPETHGVKIFERLGEVKNFSWDLFEPLMNGGEITFKGEKFFIDKSLSNPNNIGYPEYFTSDAIKEIPEEVKKLWPVGYVEEIDKFESFADVTDRMIDTLKRLMGTKDKNYRVIIVTHDALTGSIVKIFTSDQFSGINPGEFISLERKNDKLMVTRAGSITEGADTDVTA
jgi:broad specificity phosphatase PhoE